MDRRFTPANGRVAHVSLKGRVAADRFVAGEWRRVVVPVTDILARPGGARDRQLLYGARVLVLEVVDGYAFIQAERDGYAGYLSATDLGRDGVATHRVCAPATHLYPAPDIKQRETARLSLGARLTVVAEDGPFLRLESGAFAIARHLCRVTDHAPDPVAVARGFLGTPYLWGGDSRDGIDCSGLVQAACLACGIPCPADSDRQQQELGILLEEGSTPRRGDVVFWKGHVALVADSDLIVHANGHDMAVVHEELEAARQRIAAQGGGAVTAHRRLALAP